MTCAAAANPVYGLAGPHSAVVLFYEVAPISLVGNYSRAVQVGSNVKRPHRLATMEYILL